MSSPHPIPTPDPRFFTQDWTITLPTHPHLHFTRLHPGNHSLWLTAESDPSNNIPPGFPGQDINWTTLRKEETRTRFLKKYAEFQEKHNGLDILVLDSSDGDGDDEIKILGTGQAQEVTPLQCNIGMELLVSARGKGVGKALFKVLLYVSNQLVGEGMQVSAGTLKGNVAMRKLAGGMGFVETEEVVEVPGRGVVAEVCWRGIKKEEWRDFGVVVEFKEMLDGLGGGDV